jgi:hypothetical protein
MGFVTRDSSVSLGILFAWTMRILSITKMCHMILELLVAIGIQTVNVTTDENQHISDDIPAVQTVGKRGKGIRILEQKQIAGKRGKGIRILEQKQIAGKRGKGIRV